jgi:hypothetical protein
LDRAGIDTAAEGDEEQIHMQQQQQQLTAGVTDIAALSAVEQPLLGPAGSSQQQQQQQEAEEGEELELSEDMAEMADLLKGVSDATMFRERMEEALTTGGGGELVPGLPWCVCVAADQASYMQRFTWRRPSPQVEEVSMCQVFMLCVRVCCNRPCCFT